MARTRKTLLKELVDSIVREWGYAEVRNVLFGSGIPFANRISREVTKRLLTDLSGTGKAIQRRQSGRGLRLQTRSSGFTKANFT